METRKGEKVKIFKKIRRQGYRRTRGHRQFETVLRVTAVAGGGKTDTWDGAVDLTPRAVLNARARGLKTLAESLMAESTLLPVAKAKPAAKKAAAPKAEAAPAAEAPAAEAPAKPAAKKAAPKKAAEAKAEEAPAKKAPAKKSKPAAEGGEA